MKSNRIALLTGFALMVPTGAHAQDSNVTLFGIIDTYVGFQNDERATNGDGGVIVGSGGQSQSRLGVKGQELLSGELYAIFRLEGAVLSDAGQGLSSAAGLDFRRRSFVGLKGRFGQVTLGRDYTPLFWSGIDNDVSRFGHDANDGNLGQANRVDNGVHYQRSFGAATVNAVYAVETGVDDIWGVALRYKTKNWRASIGYHDEAGVDVYALGAQVSFGGFKVGFNAVDNESNPSTNFGLSLGSKLGAAGDILVNVKRRNKETHYQAYYRHSLSKRTNLYIGYGDEDTRGAEFRAGIRYRF